MFLFGDERLVEVPSIETREGLFPEVLTGMQSLTNGFMSQSMYIASWPLQNIHQSRRVECSNDS